MVLTALAAAWAIFHATALGKLTTQPEGESFRAGGLRSSEIGPPETVSETSANASIGDLNGDGYLDVVLAKGRHWPVPSRILFGDGKGNFTPGPRRPVLSTTRPELIFSRFHTASLDSGLQIGGDWTTPGFGAEPRVDIL